MSLSFAAAVIKYLPMNLKTGTVPAEKKFPGYGYDRKE
jgi:hypothetical protein